LTDLIFRWDSVSDTLEWAGRGFVNKSCWTFMVMLVEILWH